MKPKILLLMAILVSFSSCNAQDKESDKKALSANEKEITKPKGDWKVNREYDENGNLISYDSTYTYSYSNVEGDTLMKENMDEMLAKFHQYFGNQGMQAQSFFFNDSLNSSESFFIDPFFSHRFSGNNEDIQRQMRAMDSLHQEFLKQYFPQFKEEEDQKIIPKKTGHTI